MAQEQLPKRKADEQDGPDQRMQRQVQKWRAIMEGKAELEEHTFNHYDGLSKR